MALALSLSFDLFLMKGNLLIAVRAQPETDRRTDRQGRERQNKPEGGGGKENKRKKAGGQNRGLWLTFLQREPGERCRERAEPLDTQTTDNNVIDTTIKIYILEGVVHSITKLKSGFIIKCGLFQSLQEHTFLVFHRNILATPDKVNGTKDCFCTKI